MASLTTSSLTLFLLFFFNDTATTEIYTLSLHDALPICLESEAARTAGDQPHAPRQVKQSRKRHTHRASEPKVAFRATRSMSSGAGVQDQPLAPAANPSNTASITRSASAAALIVSEGVRQFIRCSAVRAGSRPFSMSRANAARILFTAASSASLRVSMSVTARSALSSAVAMPVPIRPAPTTATDVTATRSALSTWTNMRYPSPSGEARRPLFQKRSHTLAVIGGASRIALKNALTVELWPEACFERVPAHLADCRQRLGGSGGEFVRQGERRVLKSFGGHDPVDQSPFKGFRSGYLVAEQHHLHGAGPACGASKQKG